MFDIFNYVPGILWPSSASCCAASAVRILPEYERGVLFRLGRLGGSCGGPACSSSFRGSTGWCG